MRSLWILNLSVLIGMLGVLTFAVAFGEGEEIMSFANSIAHLSSNALR